MAIPDSPASRPNSEEFAPVTAPAVPGRSVLGVLLIVFGAAVVAIAAVILVVQWLSGGERIDPAGLGLTAVSGLLWAAAGLLFWRRTWILGSLVTIAALVCGALATWMIQGRL